MRILTVNIEGPLEEKAILALLDALELDYHIDDSPKFEDETERITANTYLADKINQGRKDMGNKRGTKIATGDLWK